MALIATSLSASLAFHFASAVILCLVLVRLRRDYDRRLLPIWIRSSAALAGFYGSLLVSSMTVTKQHASLIQLLPWAVAGAFMAHQLVWMHIGCRTAALADRRHHSLSRFTRLLLALSGASLGLWLLRSAPNDERQSLILVAAHSLAATLIALATIITIVRRPGRRTRSTLLVFSFALGLMIIAGAAQMFWALTGVFRGLVLLPLGIAMIQVIVHAALALSLFVLLLDGDREAAVHEASLAEHVATHDVLSGLPNRALFFERLDSAIARAKNARSRAAVLFLDLDRFKLINDSLGHSFGDAVIKRASDRLLECVRESGTIARFGGDEFVVLLPEITDAQQVAAVARRVLDRLSEPFEIEGRELAVTTSVGISLFPDDETDPVALVNKADTAMYSAKETGRNGYRFFAPAMNTTALETLELESDLRRAIRYNQFVLHYQPLLDVDDGSIFGLEALLRWNHPRLGLLMPDRFITTAERTGQIIPIGNWVLETACRQASNWQRQLRLDLVVAVNLSPRQLDQPDLTGLVLRALERSNLAPESLELEITETDAMANVEHSIAVLSELKKLGVRISIDDFGTGYSSLSYLQRLPIDTLKLDQAFVQEITEPEDGIIARGVIAMAHSLQLRVLAEGVETLGQLEFLRDHACDRLQGFLFSKPLEPVMFEKYFISHGQTTGAA